MREFWHRGEPPQNNYNNLKQALLGDPPTPFYGAEGVFDGRQVATTEGNLFTFSRMWTRVNDLSIAATFKLDNLGNTVVVTKEITNHFGTAYRTRSEAVYKEGVLLAKRVDYSRKFPFSKNDSPFRPVMTFGLYGIGSPDASYGGAIGIEVTEYKPTRKPKTPINVYKIMEGKDYLPGEVSPEDVESAGRDFANIHLSLGAPNWSREVQLAHAKTLGVLPPEPPPPPPPITIIDPLQPMR